MTWTASVCQDALLSKLFRLHDQQADALKSGAAVRQVANLSSTHHAMKACLRAWQAAINGSQPQMAKTGKAADKRLLTEGSRSHYGFCQAAQHETSYGCFSWHCRQQVKTHARTSMRHRSSQSNIHWCCFVPRCTEPGWGAR